MKKNSPHYLLDKMIEDMKGQADLFKAGNYWGYYEKNIINQIKKNKLNKFRSWEGGAGVGNIQSFGGGEFELSRYFNYHFHPFDNKFEIIDNNFFVKKYNSLTNKLSKYISWINFFSLRAPIARTYYFDRIKREQELLYQLINSLDKDLLEAKDSEFGSPIGFYKKNKFYTSAFLKTLLHINFIKKNTNFEKINSVIELGAGIGLLASAFIQLKKNLKYIVIDIPPALYISEYYLKSLNYKTFGYENLINNQNSVIDFDKYQVILLPPWKLDLLKETKLDLFINIASFQEMEKSQSLNYLKLLNKNISKYIFLNNAIKGHSKANKTGKFGVIEKTTMIDCEKFLESSFSIRKKEIEDRSNNYKTIFERK